MVAAAAAAEPAVAAALVVALAAPVAPAAAAALAVAAGPAVAAAPVAVAALAVVELVEQRLAPLVSVVAEVYSAEDPCADVDVITNDSSGRKPFHTCHTRVTLYDNCRPCGAVDVATVRASEQTHGHNQDRYAVLV